MFARIHTSRLGPLDREIVHLGLLNRNIVRMNKGPYPDLQVPKRRPECPRGLKKLRGPPQPSTSPICVARTPTAPSTSAKNEAKTRPNFNPTRGSDSEARNKQLRNAPPARRTIHTPGRAIPKNRPDPIPHAHVGIHLVDGHPPEGRRCWNSGSIFPFLEGAERNGLEMRKTESRTPRGLHQTILLTLQVLHAPLPSSICQVSAQGASTTERPQNLA